MAALLNFTTIGHKQNHNFRTNYILIDDLIHTPHSLEKSAQNDLQISGHIDRQNITNVRVQSREHDQKLRIFQFRNVFENETE